MKFKKLSLLAVPLLLIPIPVILTACGTNPKSEPDSEIKKLDLININDEVIKNSSKIESIKIDFNLVIKNDNELKYKNALTAIYNSINTLQNRDYIWNLSAEDSELLITSIKENTFIPERSVMAAYISELCSINAFQKIVVEKGFKIQEIKEYYLEFLMPKNLSEAIESAKVYYSQLVKDETLRKYAFDMLNDIEQIRITRTREPLQILKQMEGIFSPFINLVPINSSSKFSFSPKLTRDSNQSDLLTNVKTIVQLVKYQFSSGSGTWTSMVGELNEFLNLNLSDSSQFLLISYLESSFPMIFYKGKPLSNTFGIENINNHLLSALKNFYSAFKELKISGIEKIEPLNLIFDKVDLDFLFSNDNINSKDEIFNVFWSLNNVAELKAQSLGVSKEISKNTLFQLINNFIGPFVKISNGEAEDKVEFYNSRETAIDVYGINAIKESFLSLSDPLENKNYQKIFNDIQNYNFKSYKPLDFSSLKTFLNSQKSGNLNITLRANLKTLIHYKLVGSDIKGPVYNKIMGNAHIDLLGQNSFIAYDEFSNFTNEMLNKPSINIVTSDLVNFIKNLSIKQNFTGEDFSKELKTMLMTTFRQLAVTMKTEKTVADVAIILLGMVEDGEFSAESIARLVPEKINNSTFAGDFLRSLVKTIATYIELNGFTLPSSSTSGPLSPVESLQLILEWSQKFSITKEIMRITFAFINSSILDNFFKKEFIENSSFDNPLPVYDNFVIEKFKELAVAPPSFTSPDLKSLIIIVLKGLSVY